MKGSPQRCGGSMPLYTHEFQTLDPAGSSDDPAAIVRFGGIYSKTSFENIPANFSYVYTLKLKSK